MSSGTFDEIVAKIRNFLNYFTQGENSLKRRNEDCPEYSSSTKYRRVTSEFPKIINQPFEDDSHFIQPSYRDRVSMSQKKDEENSDFGRSGTQRRLFNPNMPTFAEIEFSDDEDYTTNMRQRVTQAPKSFNSSGTLKSRKSFISQENTKPRENNIPIRVERKPPPRLIPAKTSGIFASSCIPDLNPIQKNKVAGILNPAYLRNGFEDHTSGAKNSNNSTTLVNGPKVINSKNSVLSRVFNLEKKESYRNLLATLVPNLYNTVENNSRRRSTHMLNKRPTSSDRIDLASNRTKQKSIPVINLDDDDDKPQRSKEVIDLVDDEIQIISACQKLDLLTHTPSSSSSTKELPAVKPVNSFKAKLDLTPTLQPNWLSNFKERHEESTRLRSQKIKEEEENVRKLAQKTGELERFTGKRLESYIIDAKTVVLEDSESEEEEEEFPELTEDDIALVKKAIYRGPADEVLISKFNLQITRRDISTLVGDSWLNDEVINFYMNLLIERGEKRCSDGLPRVYAMNTFFIPRLMQSGYAGVRRWTRKVDLFSYDIIPVPVHVGGVHWCMAIIHLKERSIKYYDSMGTPNPKILHLLERYLQEESVDKRRETFSTSDFVKESVRDVPRQMNGSDCGVFSCMFAEYISRNKQITFSQQHMPYFRKKMILEIVQGKLLL